jgi:hypothetical protein
MPAGHQTPMPSGIKRQCQHCHRGTATFDIRFNDFAPLQHDMELLKSLRQTSSCRIDNFVISVALMQSPTASLIE